MSKTKAAALIVAVSAVLMQFYLQPGLGLFAAGVSLGLFGLYDRHVKTASSHRDQIQNVEETIKKRTKTPRLMGGQ